MSKRTDFERYILRFCKDMKLKPQSYRIVREFLYKECSCTLRSVIYLYYQEEGRVRSDEEVSEDIGLSIANCRCIKKLVTGRVLENLEVDENVLSY